jgi:hypothetical protein
MCTQIAYGRMPTVRTKKKEKKDMKKSKMSIYTGNVEAGGVNRERDLERKSRQNKILSSVKC